MQTDHLKSINIKQNLIDTYVAVYFTKKINQQSVY